MNANVAASGRINGEQSDAGRGKPIEGSAFGEDFDRCLAAMRGEGGQSPPLAANELP
jgi:hypothetical protein